MVWIDKNNSLEKSREKHKLFTQRQLLHHTVLETLIYRVVKELVAYIMKISLV